MPERNSANPEKSSSSGNWRQTLVVHILIVTGVVVLVVGALLRLAHPELTETQLFLAYWEFWVSSIVVAMVAAWLSKKLT